MNIALIDDIPEERGRLRKILTEYAGIHRLEISLQEFSCAEDFLADYRPLKYTIIFMDIYMEGMSGIEAAQKIRETDEDTILVFLTTSDDHRAEAFRCHAYDYLRKTSKPDLINETMDHILRLHTKQDGDRFSFTCDRQEYSILYADLLYLQAEGNYLMVAGSGGEEWKVRMKFSDAEDILLKDSRFLTMIRGLIVNLDYVIRISRDTCLLQNGMTLPIHTRKSREIEQIWRNYNFSKLRREALIRGGRI